MIGLSGRETQQLPDGTRKDGCRGQTRLLARGVPRRRARPAGDGAGRQAQDSEERRGSGDQRAMVRRRAIASGGLDPVLGFSLTGGNPIQTAHYFLGSKMQNACTAATGKSCART